MARKSVGLEVEALDSLMKRYMKTFSKGLCMHKRKQARQGPGKITAEKSTPNGRRQWYQFFSFINLFNFTLCSEFLDH
uniref:40S ribosomal protein S15 n=1 Tax=Syphacia muris TaxID=451379 RepID=A0A0N5ATR0_9BILA